MQKRPPKIGDALKLARTLLASGAYIISGHARLRQGERLFSVGDIQNVIGHGHREPAKDEYKTEFKDWNYAIRGNTLDGEKARVCIAFDERKTVIVVTVIRLEVKDE